MSTFITKPDYYTGKRQSVIDQLIDDDDTILDKAENFAENVVRNHLHHYDVDTIFSAVGDDRDDMVLQWCINIGLYRIYERADDSFVPESVIKNYDDTMTDLDKISQGRKQVDLPRKLEGEDEVPTTKFRAGGSQPRSTF